MTTNIDTTKYTAHLHPGKFEGESAATEYFYEQMMNGDGETIWVGAGDGTEETAMEWEANIFYVNAEEAEAFDLKIGSVFMICGDSQGFAYGNEHANREAAEQKFRDWLGLQD